MDRNREDFVVMSELLSRLAYTYGYELKKTRDMCVSMRVEYKGHEMMFSYVYGNWRLFIIDEWNPMDTFCTGNVRSLPDRIRDRIEDWKIRVDSSSEK